MCLKPAEGLNTSILTEPFIPCCQELYIQQTCSWTPCAVHSWTSRLNTKSVFSASSIWLPVYSYKGLIIIKLATLAKYHLRVYSTCATSFVLLWQYKVPVKTYRLHVLSSKCLHFDKILPWKILCPKSIRWPKETAYKLLFPLLHFPSQRKMILLVLRGSNYCTWQRREREVHPSNWRCQNWNKRRCIAFDLFYKCLLLTATTITTNDITKRTCLILRLCHKT